MRRALVTSLLLVMPAAALAGLIEPPPAIVAMWDGLDGASVRAALLPIAALGEQPGASARQKLESGGAAWWLGVQDERAGRADSALAQWRRAVTMRGDFDEGFALIDALSRRSSPTALDEAYGLAFSYADQARMGMPSRLAEAQGRLAWARQLRGHPDSALAGVLEWGDALRRRPAWTRRLATIEHAAGDHARAWKSLTLLAARTRRRDAAMESLLVLTQHALGYADEQRELTVGALRAPVEKGEWRFTLLLAARMDSLRAKDGFTVRWYRVPAQAVAPERTGAASKSPGPSRAPLLLVLAPDDSLVAADSLAAAFAAAGRTVVLLPPRGTCAAVGPGAYGPKPGPAGRRRSRPRSRRTPDGSWTRWRRNTSCRPAAGSWAAPAMRHRWRSRSRARAATRGRCCSSPRGSPWSRWPRPAPGCACSARARSSRSRPRSVTRSSWPIS